MNRKWLIMKTKGKFYKFSVCIFWYEGTLLVTFPSFLYFNALKPLRCSPHFNILCQHTHTHTQSSIDRTKTMPVYKTRNKIENEINDLAGL